MALAILGVSTMPMRSRGQRWQRSRVNNSGRALDLGRQRLPYKNVVCHTFQRDANNAFVAATKNIQSLSVEGKWYEPFANHVKRHSYRFGCVWSMPLQHSKDTFSRCVNSVSAFARKKTPCMRCTGYSVVSSSTTWSFGLRRCWE